jgi:hypothetical protein
MPTPNNKPIRPKPDVSPPGQKLKEVKPPDIGEVMYNILANQLTLLDFLMFVNDLRDPKSETPIDDKLLKMNKTTKDLLERMRLT